MTIYCSVSDIISNHASITKFIQPREGSRSDKSITNINVKDKNFHNSFNVPQVNAEQSKSSSGCKFCKQLNHSSLHC